MSIDYNTLLTPDQKREILTSRLAQFASEAYQVTLNKKTAEQVATPEQVQKIQDNLDLLEAAIRIHQDEIANLG